MRNLKRVLSLALALVMVLGMMVIGTSAATFTDAEEITYTEAVEVLSELGILIGDNGKFNPAGKLNRAGAAKLIAFMTMGEDADEYLAGSASVFTDVPADHWAAKYVAYCANLKIINGNGDDTFNPNGNISVVGFAKLVLGAAGIKGEYTGANWENNVKDAVAATPAMKATGIKITNADITREEAAALMLAGMKSGGTTTRYYYVVNEGITVETRTAANTHGTFTNPTDAYVLQTVMGAGNVDIVYDDVTTGTLLKGVYGWNYVAVDTDDFGRPAVSYNNGKTGTQKVELIFTETPALTFSGKMTAKQITEALKGYTFAVTGTTAKAVDKVVASNVANLVLPVYWNNCDVTAGISVTGENTLATFFAAQMNDKQATTWEVYANPTTKVVTKIVAIETFADKVATVTPANALTETKASITLTTASDLTTIETDKFAQYDVVLYTKSWNGTNYDVVTMEKATTFTGVLSSYTNDGKYTINGEVYEISDAEGTVAASTVKGYMGLTKVYALDQNGDIIAANAPAGSAPVVLKDYLVVMDTNLKVEADAWAGTKKVAAQVKVVLADGSTATYDLPLVTMTADDATNSLEKGDVVLYVGNTPYEIVDKTETTATNGLADLKTVLGCSTANQPSKVFTYTVKGTELTLASAMGAFAGTETVSGAKLGKNSVAAVTKASVDITDCTNKTILANAETIFVLKTATGFVVKTGVAALESTEIAQNKALIITNVAAGKNPTTGNADAAYNVNVASLVFAVETTFSGASAVNTTNLIYVDGVCTVTKNALGADVYTYTAVKADGTKIAVTGANASVSEGIYLLKSDNSIGTSQTTTEYTVGTIAGTTVYVDGYKTVTADTKLVVVAQGASFVKGAKVFYKDTNTDGVIDLIFVTEAAQ